MSMHANSKENYFLILGGYFMQWFPSEKELNETLSINGIVSPDNLSNVVCGYIEENNIYFYNGNKEVTQRVIETADTWHSIISVDKNLHYGLAIKQVI